ncbi:MAG: MFS transporter [Candidatus Nealsonbacteria bacterium]|nr:MFS transporter [Candidatus Nealsonbacteria bacterium]
MPLFPKIEKITRDASIIHFFLMFGYKSFSLYFPLFLIARGLSLPEVGYSYLLIYLPLSLFAPIAGFLNHKINPAMLSGVGILGYAVYALGMILIQNPVLFYFWQVLLGISAALFFVSIRAILMGYHLENPDRSFGWFYSAPFYADAVAPAVGAFFIWKFDFAGVFIFSLILHLFTAVFCFVKLKKIAKPLLVEEDKSSSSPFANVRVGDGFNLKDSQDNYKKIFQVLKTKTILPFLLISFSVLLLAGFYRAFFVLFLKDQLVWSQDLILIFISVFSVLFVPLSLLLIKHLEKNNSEKNVFQGSLVAGFFSIIFGLALPVLSFLNVLLINIARSAGSLICNSARSGLISKRLKTEPEEASVIDTIFAPLGVAFGALISGLVIGFLGYQMLFIFAGIFVIIVGLLGKMASQSSHYRFHN